MAWEEWGKRLKRHMKAERVTQEALAELMGVTQGSIAHWIKGRREINLTDFMVLCAKAGASPAHILFGDSEELSMLSDLKNFLAANPKLQEMIAKPAVPPIIAAASLPPAPSRKKRRKVAAR